MKVIIACRDVYPFNYGYSGSPKYIYNLCKYLVKQGVDVEIATSLNSGKRRTEIYDGIKYTLIPPNTNKRLTAFWCSLFGINLVKYLRGKDFDILHGYDVVPYVFGYTTVKPTLLSITPITSYREGDGLILVDYQLSTGECELIETVIQNSIEKGPFTASTTLPFWEHYTGAAGQVASPSIIAEIGDYDTLDNICHVVARIGFTENLDVRFRIFGLKLFDPRNSPQTFVYSNNPALALARVYVDCGYTVDWDSVADAANYCDEDVEGLSRWTLNTDYFKRWIHEGGISTPLVVHWPARIKAKGQLRHQVGHITDIMPTFMEVAGARYPKEYNGCKIKPMEGKSLVPAFDNKPVNREYICWEHHGNRGIRVGKWKLVAYKERNPWELYDMEKDRTELNNLVEEKEDLATKMENMWYQWAKRCNVLPMNPKRKKK